MHASWMLASWMHASWMLASHASWMLAEARGMSGKGRRVFRWKGAGGAPRRAEGAGESGEHLNCLSSGGGRSRQRQVEADPLGSEESEHGNGTPMGDPACGLKTAGTPPIEPKSV